MTTVSSQGTTKADNRRTISARFRFTSEGILVQVLMSLTYVPADCGGEPTLWSLRARMQNDFPTQVGVSGVPVMQASTLTVAAVNGVKPLTAHPAAPNAR